MYINPNKFSKIFREYTERVNQGKAPRIPYESWCILHKIDMDWPREEGCDNIRFESTVSCCNADTDAFQGINVSYIYGTSITSNIEIPQAFYTELIKASSIIPPRSQSHILLPQAAKPDKF